MPTRTRTRRPSIDSSPNVDTAVILAGGKGTRLRPETTDKPKPMVLVQGRPIIEWIIGWLSKNGVKNIILSVDYKQEVLRAHIGDGKRLGVKITYNDHSGCQETGDVFRSIFKNMSLPDTFLAMNGDQITDLSVSSLVGTHKKTGAIATLVTTPVRMPYGIISVDKKKRVVAFREKPTLDTILMSAGVYVFNKEIEKHLPKQGSIEATTFASLAKKKKLGAHVFKGLFVTINTVKDLDEAETILQGIRKKKI